MSYNQGDAIPLTVQFYEYAGGPAADVTGLTVTITKVGAGSPVLGPVSSGISHPATGLYTYVWTTTLDTEAATYTVVWDGTDADSDPVQASEVLTVGAFDDTVWATAAQTLAWTQVTVTDSDLLAAQGLVEVFADVTSAATQAGNIGPKNLLLLQKAVAYQAAWMTLHPDVFLNIDISQMQQDQASFTSLHANSGVLAPLAKRCIDRLSWHRSRSLRLKRPGGSVTRTNQYDSAVRDDSAVWTPM